MAGLVKIALPNVQRIELAIANDIANFGGALLNGFASNLFERKTIRASKDAMQIEIVGERCARR